jgi:hypothetical protein
MENKTKEEVIKEAYSEYWDKVKSYVDENGFVKYGDIRNETIGFKDSDIEITDYNFNIDFEVWRPKSLKGIESNNSWHKIESENDLPKEDCNCWIVTESYSTCLALFLSDTKRFWELADLDFRLIPTHYKILEEPKPPLY